MVRLSSPASPESPMAKIDRELTGGEVILLDGATGTELIRRGAAEHGEAWVALATHEVPDTLRAVHEDYIRAGARVITANTFANSRILLEPAGLGRAFGRAHPPGRRGRASRRGIASGPATRWRWRDRCPTWLPSLPAPTAATPARLPPPEVVRAAFREMARTLAESGADLILLEMMSDPALANPAIAAARETGLPVWVGYSCRPNPQGQPVSFAVEDLSPAAMLESIRVEGAAAVGIMHTPVEFIGPLIEAIRTQWEGPVMAYPDSGGRFEMPRWITDPIPPAEFADAALGWIEEGARIVGACCGFGVEYIDALANALARSRH